MVIIKHFVFRALINYYLKLIIIVIINTGTFFYNATNNYLGGTDVHAAYSRFCSPLTLFALFSWPVSSSFSIVSCLGAWPVMVSFSSYHFHFTLSLSDSQLALTFLSSA